MNNYVLVTYFTNKSILVLFKGVNVKSVATVLFNGFTM